MIKVVFNVVLSLYHFLSPYIISKGNCRYIPTCSFFSGISLSKHCISSACFLIIRRFFRCTPFGFKGYDPVPFCFYLI